jgi:hypothetical protein
MEQLKSGDRVRIGTGATGVVAALVRDGIYRVTYDHPDPLGNASGDYLSAVLAPYKGKPRAWPIGS